MNLNDISAHWVALHEQLGLGAPIAGKAQYERLLACVDALMEDYDDRPGNPLGGLLLLLAERIREYEERTRPWPECSVTGWARPPGPYRDPPWRSRNRAAPADSHQLRGFVCAHRPAAQRC